MRTRADRVRPAPGSPALNAALSYAAVSFFIAAGLELSIVLLGPGEPRWLLPIIPALALLYAATGFVAWRRQPANRVGAVLVLAGWFWLISGLENAGLTVLIAIGQITGTLPFAVIVHLVLVFPTGRSGSRAAHLAITLAYITTTVVQLPLFLFTPDGGPATPWQISDRPDLDAAAHAVQRWLAVVIVVATAVLVVRRYRSATPAARRVIAPVAGYGVAAVALILLTANVISPLVGWSPVTLFVVQIVILALVPVAFMLGVLRGGFARTAEIVELGRWFGAEHDQAELAAALGATLGDPTAEVLFWLDEPGHYVDAEGHVVSLPDPRSGRSHQPIELGGRSVGAIVYDETLVAEPELVQTAGRVLAMALDRQRLTLELVTSRDALRDSRARIVEAGDRGRRQYARDLHDGLQGRLVVLAILAQRLANRLYGEDRQQATTLRSGLDAAITEVRSLVHDVMPALLIERGLRAATEEIVDRMPIPTRLLADDIQRLPQVVETAAFFVVAEGLANGLKHSGAGEMSVRLSVVDASLHIEIADDGIGGVEVDNGGDGSGLRGIGDRVDALGGRLRVDSPAGRGTRVLVQVPCGS